MSNLGKKRANAPSFSRSRSSLTSAAIQAALSKLASHYAGGMVRWFQALCRLWPIAAAGIALAAYPSAARAQSVGGQPDLKALYAVVGRIHNIDADLLEAMVQVESGGDPQSVSPKGAMGLMQLMPGTASEFSVADPFDPVSNVLGAAGFLDYLRTRLSANLAVQGLPDLLAAYNAGPKAVEKYRGVPPYPETRQYVRRVLDRYTSKLTARPAPMPQFVLRTVQPAVRPQPIVLIPDKDSDDSLLDQLTAIRRMRAQYIVTIPRRLTRTAGLASRP